MRLLWINYYTVEQLLNLYYIKNKSYLLIAVKKAYYKLALKVHPDKVTGKEKSAATEKFQLLSKLYQVLSNPKKRSVYDKTGKIFYWKYILTLQLFILSCVITHNILF